MAASDGSSVRSPLRRAAERFAQWRRDHELGTRIPEQLWQLAVQLAGTYGVSRTATTLRLDYYSLKRHVTQHDLPAASTLASPGSSPFVELPPSTFGASGEYIIDLENSRGAKMRIHCKGTPPDLAALSHRFWSAE